MAGRGGRCWFAVDSKSFDISVVVAGGKLKGVIVDKGRGLSAWIRSGDLSLCLLLEGVEACCKDEALERWSKGWEEGGRRFKLESHSNGAGEFWFCFVVAEEGNRFALIFCEGRGLHGGWVVLAEKLQSLGFIPLVETREVASLAKVRSKPRVVKDFRSFAELVRKDLGVVGDALWLQIGEREVLHREEFLSWCLVGWFGEGLDTSLSLSSVKNCVTNLWSLKMAVKVSTFGGALLLFEFEDKSKAERVLVRGSRRIKDNLLHLARWTLEAGCLLKSGVVKEVWVRVLGLPLHLWSQEVLKKIRDYCGGFVAMDDDTTFLSILLWARILVKSEGRVLPGLLQVVVGSFSFSIQLWWEVSPWFPLVMLRNNKTSELQENSGAAGGSCTNKGAGKELHHSLSSDVIVSCLHRKEVASEAVLVSIAISAEEGDYLGRDGRSTTGEDKGCWVEPCFKDGLVGFGFGSLKLCCQGLEEAQDFKGSSLSKA